MCLTFHQLNLISQAWLILRKSTTTKKNWFRFCVKQYFERNFTPHKISHECMFILFSKINSGWIPFYSIYIIQIYRYATNCVELISSSYFPHRRVELKKATKSFTHNHWKFISKSHRNVNVFLYVNHYAVMILTGRHIQRYSLSPPVSGH